MLNKTSPQKHYILVDLDILEPVVIEFNNNEYIFIVDDSYFESRNKNSFSIKEKLYILGLPISIFWSKVSKLDMYLMKLKYYTISPHQLQINVFNKNIKVSISNKSRRNYLEY